MAANDLIGLRLLQAAHAGDMRGFGFGSVGASDTERWWLHIQCSWRFETNEWVITGSSDWYRPVSNEGTDEEWDPARGGSIQEIILRRLFNAYDTPRGSLRNNTELFTVQRAEVNQ
jgi:hypothetical protein